MTGRSELTYRSASPRLPTRCPACKGALIQRMPRPSHGTFISFHCLFCKNIWKFHLDDPRASPTGELTGDVFIVTKRRMKYKLASVAVHAVPEDILKKHLERKTTQRELERRKLQRDIDRLAAMLRMSQAEEDRLWKILKRDERNLRKTEAWSVAYNRCKDISNRIEHLQAQRQHLVSGEYLFADLPAGMSTAQTDADGKFTLAIPRRGHFGLVARAPRELFKGKETVFWFVWVTLDGQSSKHLLLSNDNMLGAGSLDSALR
jgi:hypothetical protein